MLIIFKELTKATKERITKWERTLKVDADVLKYSEMYDAYYNQMYPELKEYYTALEKAYNVIEIEKDKVIATFRKLKNNTTEAEIIKEYNKSRDVINNGYVVDNLQEALALSKKSYDAAEAMSKKAYNNWYLTVEEINIIDEVLKEALSLSKKAYDAVKALDMEKDSDELMSVRKDTYKESCFNAKKALDNAQKVTYNAHDKAWFDKENGKTYRKRYWKSRADLWLTYFSLRVYLLFEKHY